MGRERSSILKEVIEINCDREIDDLWIMTMRDLGQGEYLNET